MAAVLAEFFELNMVWVALPDLYQEFGNPATVGWVLTVFALVGAASAAVGGRIGDVIGYRKVLVFVMLAGAVGSVVSATSDNLGQLILGRALQGLTAVALPLAIGMIRSVVSEARQKFTTGVLASMAFVGGAVAMFIAGQIIERSGWRSIFWVSAAFAGVVALLVMTLPKVQERVGSIRDIDFIGGTLFAPGIALSLAGVTQITTWGLGSPATLGLIFSGVLVLAGWYLYEKRHPSPMIDVKLFRNRAFAISCIAITLYAAGPFGLGSAFPALMMGPTWTGAGFGMSPSVYGSLGLILLPLTFACSLLAGWLTQKRGAAFTVIGGATFTAIAVGALIVGISAFGTDFVIVALLSYGAYSASLAFVNAGLPTFVIEAIPKKRTGEAIGVQQVVKQGGQAIGLQLVAVLLGFQLVSDPARGPGAYPSQSTILVVLSYGTAMALLVVVVTLFARSSKVRRRMPAEAAEYAQLNVTPHSANVKDKSSP
jgi:MFS family permease